MTYKLNSMIEAEKVSTLIELAKTNWKALPYWFITEYERGNITIGANAISFSTVGSFANIAARETDYLVLHSMQLHVIPIDKFERLYSPETDYKLFTKDEIIRMLDLLIENPGVIHDAITNEHTEVDGEELFDTAINLLSTPIVQ